MKCTLVLVATLCLLGATRALAEVQVTVMTRNLYAGADLDAVLSAPRNQLPVAVAQAWQTFQETSYAERMAAIADEIALTSPHLVGLQEVTLIRSQSPGDSMDRLGSTPAENLEADFLKTLLKELEVRGLDYRVAAEVENFDIEVPKANEDGSYDDLRLTDFDVILARDDVITTNAASGTYAAALHFQGISLPRGWVAVDATINPTTVRFASTHLESAPTVRHAQGVELIRILALENRPLILVGDFNTAAPDNLTYQSFLRSGYIDLWAGDGPGFTCCQAGDLSNQISQLYERIDIVFTRNIAGVLGESTLIGDMPTEITESVFWPSDHAGVIATFQP
jgi:endonuclease/exonuclease/phosphatase family metal-dependent hydrolase